MMKLADKKTIAICGDSWFSIDIRHQGASFGEYICNKNNWELVSLARPGSSNFAIALQIDEAIKNKVDFVIFGTTSVDRLELLTKDNTSYNKLNGISNIKPNGLTPHYRDIKNQTFITDTIGNMLTVGHHKEDITHEKRHALKEYVVYCYDDGIKRQYDSWIISDACRRLLTAKIPFMLFYESTYHIWSDQLPKDEFLEDIKWIPNDYLVTDDEFLYNRDLLIPNNAVFHYCEKTGGKIWGEFIQSKYNKIMQC